MNNDDTKKRIKRLLKDLFGNTDVEQEQTAADLRELRKEIDELLSALPDA